MHPVFNRVVFMHRVALTQKNISSILKFGLINNACEEAIRVYSNEIIKRYLEHDDIDVENENWKLSFINNPFLRKKEYFFWTPEIRDEKQIPNYSKTVPSNFADVFDALLKQPTPDTLKQLPQEAAIGALLWAQKNKYEQIVNSLLNLYRQAIEKNFSLLSETIKMIGRDLLIDKSWNESLLKLLNEFDQGNQDEKFHTLNKISSNFITFLANNGRVGPKYLAQKFMLFFLTKEQIKELVGLASGVTESYFFRPAGAEYLKLLLSVVPKENKLEILKMNIKSLNKAPIINCIPLDYAFEFITDMPLEHQKEALEIKKGKNKTLHDLISENDVLLEKASIYLPNFFESPEKKGPSL